MKRTMEWMSAAATLHFVVPLPGGQNDARLPPLFDRLLVARPAEAEALESRIWELWTISGDAVIDRLMGLGLQAMAIERYDTAISIFDEIVRRAPGFAEGWNKRATVHYLTGELEKSIEDVEKVLALEPRHFGALSGLGLIALALGEEERALDAFEAALEIHPNLPGGEARVRALRVKVKGRRKR